MHTTDIPTPTAPTLYPYPWPALSGRIGEDFEDFQVDEIPLYEACGEGTHRYVHIEKRGLNTDDVVRRLAKAADVSPKDIGYAGLKDRHAVTTQWFSVSTQADADDWDVGEGVRVLAQSLHGNKLRTGHLSGNRFQIRIVDLEDSSQLLERAQALLAGGVFNGFDAQRFGRGGSNLARAIAWAEGRNRRVSPFQRKLYSSVLQSEVFNRYLAARVERGPLQVMSGDVLRLDGNRSVFVSADPVVDEQRRLEGDVHVTGPMFGPKGLSAEGDVKALEESCISALGLSEEALQRLAKAAPGARRDLLLWLKEFEVILEGPHRAVVRFELDAGAYATNVIRHLLRGPWTEDLRGSGGTQ